MLNKGYFPFLPLWFLRSNLETNTLTSGLQVTWKLYLTKSLTSSPIMCFIKVVKALLSSPAREEKDQGAWNHGAAGEAATELWRTSAEVNFRFEAHLFCSGCKKEVNTECMLRNCRGQASATFCGLQRCFWWMIWFLRDRVWVGCRPSWDSHWTWEWHAKACAEKMSTHIEVRRSWCTVGSAIYSLSGCWPIT